MLFPSTEGGKRARNEMIAKWWRYILWNVSYLVPLGTCPHRKLKNMQQAKLECAVAQFLLDNQICWLLTNQCYSIGIWKFFPVLQTIELEICASPLLFSNYIKLFWNFSVTSSPYFSVAFNLIRFHFLIRPVKTFNI